MLFIYPAVYLTKCFVGSVVCFNLAEAMAVQILGSNQKLGYIVSVSVFFHTTPVSTSESLRARVRTDL